MRYTFRLVFHFNKIIREAFNDGSDFGRLNWRFIYSDKNGLRGLHNHYTITLKIVRMDQLKSTERNSKKATNPFLPLYCAFDH